MERSSHQCREEWWVSETQVEGLAWMGEEESPRKEWKWTEPGAHYFLCCVGCDPSSGSVRQRRSEELRWFDHAGR